jgi:hypothetical protein
VAGVASLQRIDIANATGLTRLSVGQVPTEHHPSAAATPWHLLCIERGAQFREIGTGGCKHVVLLWSICAALLSCPIFRICHPLPELSWGCG